MYKLSFGNLSGFRELTYEGMHCEPQDEVEEVKSSTEQVSFFTSFESPV